MTRILLTVLMAALVIGSAFVGREARPAYADTLFSSSFGDQGPQNPVTVDGWVDGDGAGIGVSVADASRNRAGSPTEEHLQFLNVPDFVVSNAVSTEGYANLQLSFWCAYDGGFEAIPDELVLEVSLNGGAGWQEVQRWDAPDANGCPEGNNYAQRSVALPQEAEDNPDFQFRFRRVFSSAANLIVLDDVELTGDPVATGTLEVRKTVLAWSDPGLFDLLIDGSAEASDVGSGGTTGEVAVTDGPHTVSEEAGTDTTLADYWSSVYCRDDDGHGSVVAASFFSGTVEVQVDEGDDIVCTITNTPIPSWLSNLFSRFRNR
jgi:hypothetical protein